MTTIEELRMLMEAAAERQDFEEARRLRDRITLLRGGASDQDAELRTRPGWSARSQAGWASAPANKG